MFVRSFGPSVGRLVSQSLCLGAVGSRHVSLRPIFDSNRRVNLSVFGVVPLPFQLRSSVRLAGLIIKPTSIRTPMFSQRYDRCGTLPKDPAVSQEKEIKEGTVPRGR